MGGAGGKVGWKGRQLYLNNNKKVRKKEKGNLQNGRKYCKSYIQKGIKIQIYKKFILNSKKLNNLVKKWAKGPKKHLFQRHKSGQWAHEKMFNITNNQKDENQNHDEVSLHTC